MPFSRVPWNPHNSYKTILCRIKSEECTPYVSDSLRIYEGLGVS